MKLCKIICLTLAVIILLGGCTAKTVESETQSDGRLFDSGSGESGTGGVKIDMGAMADEDASAKPQTLDSIDDYLNDLGSIPAVGATVFQSFDDIGKLGPLIYNGSDVEFYYQVGSTAGNTHTVGFMLNGVYQDIKLEYDSIVTDYATRHDVLLEGGSKIFKVYLRPNIGKKGDVLRFCNMSINNSSARVTSENDWYRLSDLNAITHAPVDFIMNADCKQTAQSDFSYSGASVGAYSKNAREGFNENNPTDEICQIRICTDPDSYFYYEDDLLISSSKMEIGKSGNERIYAMLSGKSGTTQRISLYINNKIVPVFDGKEYADVKMERDKQTTVEMNIDASSLDEWNSVYMIAFTLNAQNDEAFTSNQSEVSVLRVRG